MLKEITVCLKFKFHWVSRIASGHPTLHTNQVRGRNTCRQQGPQSHLAGTCPRRVAAGHSDSLQRSPRPGAEVACSLVGGVLSVVGDTHWAPLPSLKATFCSKVSEFQPVIKRPWEDG